MTQIEFYCGTHRSGREGAIDALVARHWGRALLITSTHGLAGRRLESMLAAGTLPGGFGTPVCEFTGFAEDLIAAEGQRPSRMGSLDRLLLMQGCLHALAAERTTDDAGPDPLAPGWPRHLLDVVTQLKQAAIEPDEFAARVKALKNPGPFEALVAGAYARYQAALHDSGAYDVPGLYWEARDICVKGAPRILAGVDLVALDGFDDFTPSQMRLIAALAPQVPRLVIGLNLDMRPDRGDLFELPARTHARLKAVLAGRGETVLETQVLETPLPANWVRYAAGRLVPRDSISAEERDRVLEGLENNVRLIPCLDGQHELETVAREVKRLIVDGGTAPGSIAVAFREFGSVAGPLREVFREFGIPCRVRHRTPLRESASGGFLLRLLEAVGGWTRPAVVDVAASSWFQPKNMPGPVDAAPMLAREANHVAGRTEWFDGLDWLEKRLDKRGETDDDAPGRLPLSGEEAKAALAALRSRSQVLAQLDDSLPARASLEVHTVALAGLMQTCRMERGLDLLADGVHRRAEQDALLVLARVIETLHDADRTGESLSRAEFTGMLSQAMDGETFVWPDDRAGVWCGQADALRHETFDHVYYCGANEGVAPRPPSSSAIYPQTDVERLREAGVELSGAAEHASMERLLFHHALCAAEETFTVTWRMQGTDGREALPGAFVAELRDLLGDHTLVPRPRADSLVPAPGDAACLRDAANALFLRGDPAPAKAFAAEFADIAAALAVEKSRHSEADFDVYDGVLADAAAIDWVAGRFGEGHQFSVSQIEKYLGCPFSFFVRHVLGIEELREPVEELEPLLRGTLFHEALRLLQESHPRMSAAALVAEHGDALPGLLEDALRAAFEANAWRTGPVPDALLAAERRRMAKQLLRFMKRAAELLGDEYKPAHAEAAFGRARGSRGTTLHVPESYVFAHEGVRAQFSGKVDRIDLADGGRARIIDYKTGAVPGNKDIYEGIDLQLTVYQWVVSQLLLPGFVCDEAWYCSLTKNADRDAAGKTATRMKDKWAGREAAARASIVAAVSRIRAGWFPPDPRNPESHDCPDAGRFQKMRIARKRAAMGLVARGGVQGGGEDES
jgi:ATP-dependent helicase/DNAse subunit B